MSVELKVPEVGESVSEVFIAGWLKKEGESVAADEPLVEVETDKATVEVPSPVAGRLGRVLKQQGESAQVGEVIAHLESGDESSTGPSPAAADAERAAEDDGPTARQGEDAEGDDVTAGTRVMPAAQRLLQEHGLTAEDVAASGPGGRLLKEDVQRHLDSLSKSPGGGSETSVVRTRQEAGASTAEAPRPAVREDGESASARNEEAVRMSPLRRRIAERLVEAQRTAALLTTFNEIDMSQVMELRKQYRDPFEARHGVRLGFMSFFVKATIEALKAIPELNAEIRDDHIVYKNFYDIGVAVSTPKGLVVPVLRGAERMSFGDIEKAIGDFGKRAQENRLKPEELQGGTFTISNGGVFGSLMSTPIVNPPQSGVLGMHAIQERPVAVQGEVVIRPMMYVALSYDHRIVDGREAVTFLRKVKEAIEQPTRMLLEV